MDRIMKLLDIYPTQKYSLDGCGWWTLDTLVLPFPSLLTRNSTTFANLPAPLTSPTEDATLSLLTERRRPYVASGLRLDTRLLVISVLFILQSLRTSLWTTPAALLRWTSTPSCKWMNQSDFFILLCNFSHFIFWSFCSVFLHSICIYRTAWKRRAVFLLHSTSKSPNNESTKKSLRNVSTVL